MIENVIQRTKPGPRTRLTKNLFDNEIEPSNDATREGRIITIIVPHSHTDPGWLYTVQDYYNKTVRRIIDLVVSKLTYRSEMTFIWSETIFLYMWWTEADSVKRSLLKTLVQEGRFEIAAGGWVMADPSVTHYAALLIQIQEAREWLSTKLQVSPKAAWAIDSFGHSQTLPYLWSQTGYDFTVAQRVSQNYKRIMGSRRQLEFTWRQHWDEQGSTDFFCHIPPYKFYDIAHSCGPDTSVCSLLDFKTSSLNFTKVRRKEGTESTIDHLITSIVRQLRRKAANFNHNVVLLPLGDDLRYDNEQEWVTMYANLDIIITYINNNPKFNMMMKYGTLKTYLMEVKKQYNTSNSPIYSDDFLPYTDSPNDYWTGYYSSRPEQKRAIRELQETYYAASVWNSLLLTMDSSHHSRNDLEHVVRTLSLLQHHNAITGTSKSVVIGDYRSRARDDRDLARTVICNSVQKIIQTKSDKESPESVESVWKFYEFSWERPQLISFSSRKTWYLVFVNSLPKPRNEVISIILDIKDLLVTNSYGIEVPIQINPFRESTHRISRHIYVIQIPLSIEPMSITTFTISRTIAYLSPHKNIAKLIPSDKKEIKQDLRLSNSHIVAVFSPLTGSLTYVYLKDSDTKITVTSEFLVYNSSKHSGAYVFAPDGIARRVFSSPPTIFTAAGDLSQQIDVIYKGVTLTYTLYNTENGVNAEVIYVTCQMDFDMAEMSDLEIILRFVTDIDSQGILYTDVNGFQHSMRSYKSDKPIAANYYPMTTNAVIQDNITRFTVHATHAHGVASLRNGELEIMLDRHPTNDDGKDLGQGIAYSNSHVDRFLLQFEKCNDNMCQSEFLPTLDSISANDYLQCPIINILSNTQYEQKTFKLLTKQLPPDTTIVTMKKTIVSSNQFTLQLVLHRRGAVESRNARAQPINLWSMVQDMYALNVKETSLDFSQVKRALSPGEDVYLQPMTMGAFEIGLLTV